MSNADLEQYGWDADLERASSGFPQDSTEPARVAAVDRGSVLLFTGGGEKRGVVRGGLDLATGDWVMITRDREVSLAPVVALLPRRTRLARKVAGKRSAEQTLVANVDTVLVTAALGRDFNARRIERYLSLAWAGGAEPVLVGTKLDLVDDPETFRSEGHAVAPGVAIHLVSSVTGDGVGDLGVYLTEGRTVAVVGSSGSGKSTLINALCGAPLQAVNELGWAEKGRHTTTRRQLIRVPGGGLLVDTPGLREVGLWEASGGLAGAFADVEELAARCRFNDCGHDGEPGCAVEGNVADERLASYRKLQREARSVAFRADKAARAEERRRRRRLERSYKKDAY